MPPWEVAVRSGRWWLNGVAADPACGRAAANLARRHRNLGRDAPGARRRCAPGSRRRCPASSASSASARRRCSTSSADGAVRALRVYFLTGEVGTWGAHVAKADTEALVLTAESCVVRVARAHRALRRTASVDDPAATTASAAHGDAPAGADPAAADDDAATATGAVAAAACLTSASAAGGSSAPTRVGASAAAAAAARPASVLLLARVGGSAAGNSQEHQDQRAKVAAHELTVEHVACHAGLVGCREFKLLNYLENLP